jgi:hypothetical protein
MSLPDLSMLPEVDRTKIARVWNRAGVLADTILGTPQAVGYADKPGNDCPVDVYNRAMMVREALRQ